MAIIATYAEGHEKHGEIIDWDHIEWVAVEQYKNESLAYLIVHIPDGFEPVNISSIGPVCSRMLNGIRCDRVYLDPVVEFEAIGDTDG